MIAVCPKCDVGLFLLKFREVEVDYCPQCAGVWLDAGELEEILRRTGAATDDPLLQSLSQHASVPTGPRVLCPRCDESLLGIRLGQDQDDPLVLDRCPRGHGLWFDAQELNRLLALFRPASGAMKTVEFLNDFFRLKPTS